MTFARAQRYDLLAALFDYPRDGDYHELLTRSIDGIGDECPAAAESIKVLFEHVKDMSLEQIQELYTRTFDINPVCTLEIGWHIYGEDYARGELLVKLREKIREVNLVESVELPDHLTHVLALLGRISGEEADELAARYVLPALDKMLKSASDADHAYLSILKAIRIVVQSDHDVEAITPREKRQSPPDWKNRLPMFDSKSCGKGEGTRGNR
jgi:nitrate reductase molybdenum cofactor assembly chaperone